MRGQSASLFPTHARDPSSPCSSPLHSAMRIVRNALDLARRPSRQPVRASLAQLARRVVDLKAYDARRATRPVLPAVYSVATLPLDAAAMHEAAQVLVGRHDFSTFRASLCQAKSPLKTLDALDVSVAGRFEDYSDFGNTTNGKLTARYTVTPAFIVRGAVSTGFRAPSLSQGNFSAISTNFLLNTTTNTLEPFQTGT